MIPTSASPLPPPLPTTTCPTLTAQVERAEAELRGRLESVANREAAAASRLQELSGSISALEQREVAVSAQGAVAEKLRGELEALQRKLDEQVLFGAVACAGFLYTGGGRGRGGPC